MDFQDLSAFFGGCILSEDIRIDLTSSRRALEGRAAPPNPLGDREQALLQVVLLSLSGNLRKAFDLLDDLEAKASAAEDDDLLVRIPIYRLHLQRIKLAPPPLYFWSDRNVEIRILQNARDCRKATAAFHKSLHRLEDKVNSHFQRSPLPRIQAIEAETLLKMWPLVHYTWNGSYLHHPGFQSRTSNLDRRIVSNGMGEYNSHIVGNLKWRGLPEAAFVTQLLTARKQKASGKPVPYLDDDAGAEVLGSPGRQAFRLLVIGDFQISNKPFTNPLANNLMLYAAGPGWNDPQWDAMEEKTLCSSRAESAATTTYKQSFDLFRSSNCNRGMAAIHLRLGCISMMKAIDRFGPDGGFSSNCQALMEEAAAEFDKATPLFGLDETHLCIVNAHQLLCRISQQHDGINAEAVESAERLGLWGAETGNPRPAIFSGMLFLKTGRRLARNRFVQQAWSCCVCARVVFAALGDATLEAKAVEAQAMYYHESGCFGLARQHLREHAHVMIEAFDDVEKVLETCKRMQKQLQLRRLEEDRGDTPSDLKEILNLTQDTWRWHSSFASLYANDMEASRYAEVVMISCGEVQAQLVQLQAKRHNAVHKLGIRIFGTTEEAEKWHSSISWHPEQRQDVMRSADEPSPGGDALARLQSWVEQLCVHTERQNEIDQNTMQRHAAKMRKYYDALRAMDSDEAAKVLDEVTHTQGTDEEQHCESPAISAVTEIPIATATKIMLLCYKGRLVEAREELSSSMPRIALLRLPSGGSGLTAMFLYLQVRMQLWLCYITRSWGKGRDILDHLGQVLVDPGQRGDAFYEQLKTSSDADRWMTMVAIGYLHRHPHHQASPEKINLALGWYGQAYRVVQDNRFNIPDIQDRRIGGSLVTPLDAYLGLAKIGISLHAAKSEVSSQFQAFGAELLGLSQGRLQTGLRDIDVSVLFLEQGKAGVLADMVSLHQNKGRLESWQQLRASMRRAESGTIGAPRHPVGVPNRGSRIPKIVKMAFQDQEALQYASQLRQEAASFDGWIKADGIYKSIPDNTLVIHVSTYLEETHVLYITNHGVQLVQRSSLTAHDLNTVVLQYLDMFRCHQQHSEDYGSLVDRLSEHIVSPATSLIRTTGTVILVPSKSLHNFPVSALTLEGVPLSESKATYFYPSLQTLALLAGRSQASPGTGTSAQPLSSGFVTFMAADTSKSGQSQPNVAAAFAIQHAEDLHYNAIPANKMEKGALVDEIRTSSVGLISSHGHVGAQTPRGNKLSLRASLSVTEILGSTFSASVLIFQACLSSTSGLDDGDDVVGFSHAVLSSGANSFIGALWKVNELAASLLISFFMSQLKNCYASLTMADALRNAQAKLRRTTVAQVVEILSSVRDTISRAQAQKRFSEHKISLRTVMRTLKTRIDEFEGQAKSEHPYNHPYFWAPFVLVGYGHMKLKPLHGLDAPMQKHPPACKARSDDCPDL